MAARFESEEAARANSDRPEQGAWWSDTEKYFDGPAAFVDSSDVDVQVEPRNDAGFVQVIQSRVLDRPRVEAMNAEVGKVMAESRPDIVGAVSVWSGNDVCDIAYFTIGESGAGRRAAGASREAPKMFEEWQSLIEGATYLDLKDPWLY